MRGRKPLPTRLKLVTGNPGNRPLNLAEPRPDVDLPDMPRHLVGEAAKEWKRISRELVKLGLLTRIDRAALSLYCTQWARHVAAERQIARLHELMLEDPEAGLVDRTPQGYRIQSVWLQISNKAFENCVKILAEFGMSPSSRSRVQASPQGSLFPDGDDEDARKWGRL